MLKHIVDCSTGEKANIEMSAEEIADRMQEIQEATAREVQDARILQRQIDAKNEASLATELKTVTPQQAVNWIESNVTDLASAKRALKIMVRMLIALRDRTMPDLPDSPS